MLTIGLMVTYGYVWILISNMNKSTRKLHVLAGIVSIISEASKKPLQPRDDLAAKFSSTRQDDIMTQ
jgi:hypothetical protein